MKVFIVNDTSDNRHFGCKLTMQGIRKQLAARDVEIMGRSFRGQTLPQIPCNSADDPDLVIVNGEGCIHHDGYRHLLKWGAEYPAILTNMSFQSMTMSCKYELDSFKCVTVRESLSRNYMRDYHGHAPELVPDAIFTHYPDMVQQEGVGTFFTDSAAYRKASKTRHVRADDYVATLNDCRDVIAGRFHAICVAAMLHKPFTAYKSNTWKNAGIMMDMRLLHRYSTEIALPSTVLGLADCLSQKIAYCEDAVRRLDRFYDDIANGVFA